MNNKEIKQLYESKMQHHQIIVEQCEKIINHIDSLINLEENGELNNRMKRKRRLNDNVVEEGPEEYVTIKKLTKKLRFILNERGRPMTQMDFESVLREKEGVEAELEIERLKPCLRNMHRRNDFRLFSFNMSAIEFYAFPEWQSDNGQLKQEFCPGAEEVKDIDPNLVNIENIKFH